MKNYSSITENKDIITKEYADSNFMPFSGGTFKGNVTFSSGQGHLRTDLIKSADDSKRIAEFTSSGLELGGSGYALRFYSSTRPVVANLGKELAYTSDIPDISGKQDIITESNKLSASLVSGLAQVATTGSYNDLLNKPTIPAAVTSINGLSGGTLTSPLTLTGGDSATASKIILSSNGQITDSGTATMLGFSGGNYIVGSGNYPTTFRGKQTRPTWNGKDLALKSDIPTIPTLATVATTGSYNDLSNKPTILSEADVKGIKVNNAVYADSAGYVKNSIVYQGVGLNADANYSNFVTYNGSTARSIKFYKYDFQMQDALGSGDAEITLRNTGVTEGTYNSVTVDAKGRVTAGTNTPAVDTSNLAKLDAENTFTKGQVITGGTSGGYSIDASGYIKGSWLQASSTTNKGSNTGKVCVFDGNGWIYYRTPSEILSEASGVPKSAFSLSGTTLTITI